MLTPQVEGAYVVNRAMHQVYAILAAVDGDEEEDPDTETLMAAWESRLRVAMYHTKYTLLIDPAFKDLHTPPATWLTAFGAE